jgi:hypothetical protein
VPLKEMLELSKEMSDEVEMYKHCEYQAMIAASIASNNSKFIVVTVPTGKTWI